MVAHSPKRLARVSYSADVAAFPDWYWQHGANRWDDPRIAALRQEIELSLPSAPSDEKQAAFLAVVSTYSSDLYRVLYTAGTATSAFIEVLQDFRAPKSRLSLDILTQIAAIAQDDPIITAAPEPIVGEVPTDFFAPLYVGDIDVESSNEFVNLEEAGSIQHIRTELLDAAKSTGLTDISRGEVLGSHRPFTQIVSRFIRQRSDRFAGIHHNSALGLPHRNWAIFETAAAESSAPRITVRTVSSTRVDTADKAVSDALEILKLKLG